MWTGSSKAISLQVDNWNWESLADHVASSKIRWARNPNCQEYKIPNLLHLYSNKISESLNTIENLTGKLHTSSLY
jgi:hypothetical protein